MKIAWIGTGVMGYKMVSHLAGHGYDVSVFSRTIEKTKGLPEKIKVAKTLKDCVVDADYVFTMVGYPKDVEDVYNEVFKIAKPGAIFIDMTTSLPTLAASLTEKAHELGFEMLDAPVTGGETGAASATLAIMVGGCKKAYENVLPILKRMGKNIEYFGKAGSGQKMKAVNQIAIANTLLGVVEALVAAEENHLNLNQVLDVINDGSAASRQAKTNGYKMVAGDFKPGFYIKHFLKDLKIAKEVAKTKLEGLQVVIHMLERLVDYDYGDEGTQALILYYMDKNII